MLRLFGMLLVVLALAACGDTPTKSDGRSTPLTAEGRDAYALLLLGPKDNPVKACATFALRLNTGLTLMRMGKTSDDEVTAKLTTGTATSSAEFRAAREQEAAVWRKTHDPGKVALTQFENCQRISGITTTLGATGVKCFGVAAVPATAEAYKAAKYNKDKAAGIVMAMFQSQLPADFLRRTVDDVYAVDAEASGYQAHRKVLADCLH